MRKKIAAAIIVLVAMVVFFAFSVYNFVYSLTVGASVAASTAYFVLQLVITAGLAFFLVLYLRKSDAEFKEKLNRRNQEVLSNIEGAVVRTKLDLVKKNCEFLYVSNGWEKITGYKLDELANNFFFEHILMAEDKDLSIESYYKQIKASSSYSLEYRIRCKDGTVIWVQDCGKVLKRAGKLFHNQSIVTDITKNKQQQQEIALNENLFRVATTLSRGVISEYNFIEKRYSRFLNGETLFGLSFENVTKDLACCREMSFEDAQEKIIRYFYYKDDYDTVKAAFKELYEKGDVDFEVRVNGIGGVPIWCRAHIISVKDEKGNLIRRICLMQDIDDLKRETEKLLSQSNQDPLTGLFNKIAATQLIEEHLKKAAEKPIALMVLDIDNFKSINDTLGHLFGDAVLINVSAKLKKLFRSGGFIGRIGGDEFVLCMPEAELEKVTEKAAEICDTVEKSYLGDKGSYKISCSVGIALSEAGDTYETLFQKADVALYEVKANGKKQFRFYDKDKDVLTMRPDKKRTAIDISYRAKNLDIKEQMFGLLYAAQDFKTNVNMILSLLGRRYDVSRVYIFEPLEMPYIISNTFEWCNDGITPEISRLQRLDFKDNDYYGLFNEKDVFYCENVLEIKDEKVKDILLSQNIDSLLQVLIKEQDEIKGFIGFDVCNGRRVWSADEIDILIYASRMIGTFVLKMRAEKNLLLEDTNKKEMLDNVPDAIYVIDKDFNLKYVNQQARQYAPECIDGEKCYKVFLNRDKRCENCPATQLKDERFKSIKLYNDYLKLSTISTASKIKWGTSEQATLICCQNISEDLFENKSNKTE